MQRSTLFFQRLLLLLHPLLCLLCPRFIFGAFLRQLLLRPLPSLPFLPQHIFQHIGIKASFQRSHCDAGTAGQSQNFGVDVARQPPAVA